MALVEFSTRDRSGRVETVACTPIEVGSSRSASARRPAPRHGAVDVAARVVEVVEVLPEGRVLAVDGRRRRQLRRGGRDALRLVVADPRDDLRLVEALLEGHVAVVRLLDALEALEVLLREDEHPQAVGLDAVRERAAVVAARRVAAAEAEALGEEPGLVGAADDLARAQRRREGGQEERARQRGCPPPTVGQANHLRRGGAAAPLAARGQQSDSTVGDAASEAAERPLRRLVAPTDADSSPRHRLHRRACRAFSSPCSPRRRPSCPRGACP